MLKLKRLDVNRGSNQVNNSIWVRSMLACSNNGSINQLLRKLDTTTETALCLLTDSQLTSLFVYISEKIDFTMVKTIVQEGTAINPSLLLQQSLIALDSLNQLQQVVYQSSLLHIETEI